MLEWLSSCPLTSKRLACSGFEEHISRYLGHLTEQRYSPKTMRTHADYLRSFAEFVEQQNGTEVSCFPESVDPFVNELASRISSAPKVRQLLNCFLSYLRQAGVISPVEPEEPPSPEAELIENYCDFLRTRRALKEQTIQTICGTCRKFTSFLAAEEMSLDALQPETIHRFLVSRGQVCRRSSLRTECSSLRCYLRYLHYCGSVDRDLSGAVIAPRVYQHEDCPVS